MLSMNILAKFGLMKRSEHEAVAKANKGLLRDILAERAKFKLAATDLAAQAEEIAAYKEGAAILHKAVTDRGVENERLTLGWEKCASDLILVRRQLDDSEAELALTRPDAQKWRAYLKRSRDRRAGKAVKS